MICMMNEIVNIRISKETADTIKNYPSHHMEIGAFEEDQQYYFEGKIDEMVYSLGNLFLSTRYELRRFFTTREAWILFSSIWGFNLHVTEDEVGSFKKIILWEIEDSVKHKSYLFDEEDIKAVEPLIRKVESLSQFQCYFLLMNKNELFPSQDNCLISDYKGNEHIWDRRVIVG